MNFLVIVLAFIADFALSSSSILFLVLLSRGIFGDKNLLSYLPYLVIEHYFANKVLGICLFEDFVIVLLSRYNFSMTSHLVRWLLMGVIIVLLQAVKKYFGTFLPLWSICIDLTTLIFSYLIYHLSQQFDVRKFTESF